MPGPTNGGRNGGRGIKNKDNKLIDSVSRYGIFGHDGFIPVPTVDFYDYAVTVLVLPVRLETASPKILR
jgi:hypothetical protein